MNPFDWDEGSFSRRSATMRHNEPEKPHRSVVSTPVSPAWPRRAASGDRRDRGRGVTRGLAPTGGLCANASNNRPGWACGCIRLLRFVVDGVGTLVWPKGRRMGRPLRADDAKTATPEQSGRTTSVAERARRATEDRAPATCAGAAGQDRRRPAEVRVERLSAPQPRLPLEDPGERGRQGLAARDAIEGNDGGLLPSLLAQRRVARIRPGRRVRARHLLPYAPRRARVSPGPAR